MDIANEIVVAFLTAVGTAVVTASVTFVGYWRKARADLESEFSRRFNNRKWEVYTEFTKLLYQNLAGIQRNFDVPFPNFNESDLISIASQIMLSGSDNVIHAFRLWRESVHVNGPGDDLSKQRLTSLVVEMRRDLGNKFTKLEMEDLSGVLRSDTG